MQIFDPVDENDSSVSIYDSNGGRWADRRVKERFSLGSKIESNRLYTETFWLDIVSGQLRQPVKKIVLDLFILLINKVINDLYKKWSI